MAIFLNRYWDEHNTPRPESYKEDVELARSSVQKPETVYRHLRAAAESGWDFSSRWFKDENFFNHSHHRNYSG
jgi:alpha,alpha-trehalase